jgi:hypothetical protein
VLPSAALFNRALFAMRRILTALRSKATDRIIFLAARLLHPDMSANMLRERVHYMYRVPVRVMSPALERALDADYGLEVMARYSYPHSSLGQPRHQVTVFRKTA